MKEADDGLGQNAAAGGTTPPDHANGKIDKDMKGLVYAGETRDPPIEANDYSPADTTSTEEKKEPQDDTVQPHEKEETILNFTEKEDKSKLIILIVVAAIIIIGVVYLALHAKGAKVTVTIPTTTVAGKSTTTIGPNYNKTSVLNIDLLYNYTGPNKLNNTSCGKSKTSTVKSMNARYNGSTTFYLYDTENSGYCPLSINKIVATTPGFRIISVTPSLPSPIPAHSSIYLIIKVQTPTFNYTGPLSITINEN